MFHGISLSFRSLPDSILEAVPNLSERTHRRSEAAAPEVWFLLKDRQPVLPVWREGQLQLMTWGRVGPKGSRIWQYPRADLESCKWASREPEPVHVPADFCCDSGVWFDVREGMEGIIVPASTGPEVYLLTQPASHYYEVMCARAEVMPCLIGQWV
jgi:hypothetical protein